MINIKVTEVLDIPKHEVWEAIRDFRSYDKWWKIPVDISHSNPGYLEFRPLPFVTIGIEVIAGKTESEIRFHYVKGPFRGYGVWKFRELEGRKTQVSYEIFLSPIHWVYQCIGNTRFFVKKHTKDIRVIIHRIKKHLPGKGAALA